MKRRCSICGSEKEEAEFSPGSRKCKPCAVVYVQKLQSKRIDPATGKLKSNKEEWYTKPERVKWSDKEKAMEPDDWPRFWRAVGGESFLVLFDLLQSCGLRAHEALLLTHRDFDFEKGVVMINTLKQKGRPQHDIFVRPDLLAKLEGLGRGPLFQYAYENARVAFKTAAKKAKLNAKLALHSLRHLCSARLRIATNGNLLAIQALLRHTPKTVTEMYSHLTMKEQKDIWSRTWSGQEWIWHTSTIHEKRWIAICDRYGNKCLCCKQRPPKISIVMDLIDEAGLLIEDNVQPLCARCKESKAGRERNFRENPESDNSYCRHFLE